MFQVEQGIFILILSTAKFSAETAKEKLWIDSITKMLFDFGNFKRRLSIKMKRLANLILYCKDVVQIFFESWKSHKMNPLLEYVWLAVFYLLIITID